MVKQVTPYLVSGAVLVALIAPVFEQLFYISRLRYAAAIAVAVIALKISEVSLAEKFTVPSILVTGMALSLKQPGSIVVTASYLLPALLTVTVAVAALYLATYIDPERLDLDIIRGAGTLVLLIISLSLIGLKIPSNLSLAVISTGLIAAARPDIQKWFVLTSK